MGSRASILPPLCSSRRDGSNDTQFDLKRSRSKFDLRSEVRSKYAILHIIRFGVMRQTYWCHFNSSITPEASCTKNNHLGKIEFYPNRNFTHMAIFSCTKRPRQPGKKAKWLFFEQLSPSAGKYSAGKVDSTRFSTLVTMSKFELICCL